MGTGHPVSQGEHGVPSAKASWLCRLGNDSMLSLPYGPLAWWHGWAGGLEGQQTRRKTPPRHELPQTPLWRPGGPCPRATPRIFTGMPPVWQLPARVGVGAGRSSKTSVRPRRSDWLRTLGGTQGVFLAKKPGGAPTGWAATVGPDCELSKNMWGVLKEWCGPPN